MRKLYVQISNIIEKTFYLIDKFDENSDIIALQLGEIFLLLDEFIKKYNDVLNELEDDYNHNFFELYLMDDSREPIKNQNISSDALNEEYYEIIDMFTLANNVENKEECKNVQKYIKILLNNLQQELNKTYKLVHTHYKELILENMEINREIIKLTK